MPRVAPAMESKAHRSRVGSCGIDRLGLLEIDLAYTSEIDLFRESEEGLYVEHAVSGNDRSSALRTVLEFERGQLQNQPCAKSHRRESIKPRTSSIYFSTTAVVVTHSMS